MRAAIYAVLLALPTTLSACANTDFPTECALYPERCCDLAPEHPACAPDGDSIDGSDAVVASDTEPSSETSLDTAVEETDAQPETIESDADDSATPDATVPDTTPVPDTLAPDTGIPDTLMVDTFVPDTAKPDTSVVDTFVPDTFVPDTLVPDTFVPDTFVPDVPPSCADAGPATEPCGKCGTRSRTCVGPGTWGPWSACGGEGVCTPGAVEDIAGSCASRLDKRRQTCSTSCTWDVACFTPKGWHPMANTPVGVGFRKFHAALWIDPVMFVFGGTSGSTTKGDGGKYRPASDFWETVPGPTVFSAGRNYVAAATFGTRAFIWGGSDSAGVSKADGATYDVVTGVWKTIAASPLAARSFTDPRQAVWSTTTNEVLIWGGEILGDGAAYDPAADSWSVMPAAPIAGRSNHAVFWTGTEMIIWGGSNALGPLRDGARYNPKTKVWTKTPDLSALLADRVQFASQFVGGELTIFGGISMGAIRNDGARLQAGGWKVLPAIGPALSPPERFLTQSWSDGARFYVWSGNSSSGGSYVTASGGAHFDPASDKWTALPELGAPTPRSRGTAVWNGTMAVVWGGQLASATTPLDGGIYVP